MLNLDSIPHNAHIHFCPDSHLINGYTTSEELFAPDEIQLLCKCGKSTHFSISKLKLSEILGTTKKLKGLKVGTHTIIKKGKRKPLKLAVYELAILGFLYPHVQNLIAKKNEQMAE